MMDDPYRVLGLQPGASDDKAKASALPNYATESRFHTAKQECCIQRQRAIYERLSIGLLHACKNGYAFLLRFRQARLLVFHTR